MRKELLVLVPLSLLRDNPQADLFVWEEVVYQRAKVAKIQDAYVVY